LACVSLRSNQAHRSERPRPSSWLIYDGGQNQISAKPDVNVKFGFQSTIKFE
jgi:hypothetical protein